MGKQAVRSKSYIQVFHTVFWADLIGVKHMRRAGIDYEPA
ncbi:uncharacterized protein G2W53_000119 [Senna tora]|uniref:Uncharacterized protein n=1 Tax=Senna tora TaxID=362788 RepID=A0A834XF40_9FABA|nr:uncharacterized protein G2W53_000119 [Senna tora]